MSLWWWLGLAGLGAFHGLNPAMGWLFAVALGLHQRRRAVVLAALIPIALGTRSRSRWSWSPSWRSAPSSISGPSA